VPSLSSAQRNRRSQGRGDVPEIGLGRAGGDEAREVGGEARVGPALVAVLHGPLRHVGEGAGEQAREGADGGRVGRLLAAHARQGGLARQDPVVDQHRMADQEGRHAQARRIADAEVALQARRQRNRGLGRSRPGDVLGQRHGEAADQVDGQHLGLEGAGELGTRGDPRAVGDAELAVAVDRRGAHQVADPAHHLLVRLAAPRQALDQVLEHPHRLVGAAQHQVARAVAPGFLARRVGRQPRDLRRVGLAVVEHEGGVPGLGDHAVAARLRGERLREGHQAVGPPLHLHRQHCGAVALGVQLPERRAQGGAAAAEAAQQGRHEAQAGGEEAAQTGETHDLRRRAQRHGRLPGRARPRLSRHAAPPARRPARRGRKSGRRNPASCRP
jgi:hypothetical protein